MANIYSNILEKASRQAARATNGQCTIKGVLYTLTFKPNEWVYVVTDESGDRVVSFNCKSLATAKRELSTWINS